MRGRTLLFDWSVVTENLPELLRGLRVTAAVSAVGFAGALVTGLLVGRANASKFKALRMFGVAYVEIGRNTPLLVQVFLVYFGLPSVGLRLNSFVAGAIALALHEGAYVAEILRAGLANVSPSQEEAGRSLGMSRLAVYRRVIYPQVVRNTYPMLTNSLLRTILGSSLLSAIALKELLQTVAILNSKTFMTFELYLAATGFYLVLCGFTIVLVSALARVWFRDRRQELGISTLLRSALRPEGMAITGAINRTGRGE